ncbi:MAG: hypothetical protein IKM29_06185 [Clostridia bacterium]|nr:hypothetical protein [Clostridia bacterium]
MLKSKTAFSNGVPSLVIDGTPVPALAYTTYFEELGKYGDFIDAGYRIFFVNVTFTLLPINSFFTGFTPFRVGVFDDIENPNYSEFEDSVRQILADCPDAFIVPRVYITMPKWWVDSHPEDVVPTPKGGLRESLYSENFRKDGGDLLIQLVRHIMTSDYAHRVAAWQLCGGLTQEWFHHDLNGSLSPASEKFYRQYVKDTFGEDNARLPDSNGYFFRGEAFNTDENARRFSEYSSIRVAQTVDYFARIVKEETSYNHVVGAFYGYTFECNNSVLMGSHALRCIIDSEYLDFFSSPNAYVDNRGFGIDWSDMIPIDSVKARNKLVFMECDIRTCLTKAIQECRPGKYPDNIYRLDNGKSVWAGPPTVELSRYALQKCFAHQITNKSGIWWFDMFGGWYDDPILMAEITRMKNIFETQTPQTSKVLTPEVVFFADESAYANIFQSSPQMGGIPATRTAIGNAGAPYSIFMVEDAEIALKNCKAAVFPFPIPSRSGKRAMELCEKLNIPYISANEDRCFFTKEELRDFFIKCGVHVYDTEGFDVVYVGNGYIGLHSKFEGKKKLTLPRKFAVVPMFGSDFDRSDTDVIEFELAENATALFALYEKE